MLTAWVPVGYKWGTSNKFGYQKWNSGTKNRIRVPKIEFGYQKSSLDPSDPGTSFEVKAVASGLTIKILGTKLKFGYQLELVLLLQTRQWFVDEISSKKRQWFPF